MAYQFPTEYLFDGQIEYVPQKDGTTIPYRWYAMPGVWKAATVPGEGGSGIVTTKDVITLNGRPTVVTSPFDATPDTIATQQDANWFIWDAILENQDALAKIVWFGVDPPPFEANTPLYVFWFDIDLLELFIYYNDSWFPASAGTGGSGVSEETFTFTVNRIQSIIDEVYLKNIEQENRLDTIEENIVELEEEIDAIAPSNERGEWTFNPVGVASPGNYAFLDGSTQPTDRFDGAAIIYVSTRDADNVTHSFNNHEVGEYLQIFNKSDDGYGLYQITDIDDNSTSPNPFFAFTVDFVRSLVTVPKATGRGRFKFFTIADGDPGAYVLKTGDEMSGNLTMVKDPFNNGDVSPKIEFKSKRDDGTVFTNALSMPYDTGNTLKATGTFESGGAIYSGGAISASGNLQYNSSTRMYLGSTADTHYLGFGTSTNYQAIQWDKSNGLVQIRAKDSYGSNGQVLTKTSSGVEWATPASPGGGMYWGRKYIYDSSTSGTPSSGRFKVHSGFLYINETDVDGNQLRHTAGDFNWQIPFYVFSTNSNHVLMASLLGTGSDYTSSGYMRIKTSGWNSKSLTNTQVYYTHLTGFW